MNISTILQQLAAGSLHINSQTKIISRGEVFDTNALACEYQVMMGANPKLASQCNLEWTEFYQQVLEYLSQINDPLQRIQEAQGFQFGSKHWDWLAKTILYKGQGYLWFFMIINNQVQGICLIYQPTDAKLEAGNVFYVEYLAAAPWNLKNPIAQKRYLSVGTTLLNEIIHHCTNALGLKYGFNLHAIQQAEGFYEKIGMQHLPAHNKTQPNGAVLKFYEMTQETTQKMIGA